MILPINKGATGLSKAQALIDQFVFNARDGGLSPDSEPAPFRPRSRLITEVVSQLDRLEIAIASKASCSWLVRGSVVREIVLDLAGQMMSDCGYELEILPAIFSINSHPALVELIARFRGELFSLPNSCFLRYASDPVLFPRFSGKTVRGTKRIYSPGLFWRNEQGNALALIRPEEFYMTDFHVICPLQLAWQEFTEAARLNKRAMIQWFTEDRFRLVVDISQEAFGNHAVELTTLLNSLGVDATIKVCSAQTHYYSCQLQFVADVFSGNLTQVSNLQLDLVNGSRFNIRSSDGHYAAIIHGTHFGRVEKILASVIGLAMEGCPERAILPFWISPIQVRFIVLDDLDTNLRSLFSALTNGGFRYDVEVAGRDLSKKVRRAAQLWIPYVVVSGQRETGSGKLSVRMRASGQVIEMSPEGFIAVLENERQSSAPIRR